MGLDGVNRWMIELILHKGYTPTQQEVESYGVPPLDFLQQGHDERGCLLTRDNKTKYWRWNVAQAKEAGDVDSMKFTMRVLTKYIRGIYQ